MSEITNHALGSPGWHAANEARTLTYRLIPWHFLPGVFFAVLMVWGAFYDPAIGLGQRVAFVALGLVLAAASAKAIVNRITKIRIGDRLEFLTRRDAIDLPSTLATKVLITRRWDLRGLSFWYIVVDVDGEEQRLLWAAHGLFGAHLNRRARAISNCLGIPIEDAKGTKYRRSRFLPLRLVAAGHDWLFHLSWVVMGLAMLLSLVMLAMLL